jgi:hypothetical protein
MAVAMAMAMDDIALHGGLIPMVPRSSASRTTAAPPFTLVMTHDAIGLGEDGQSISRRAPNGVARHPACGRLSAWRRGGNDGMLEDDPGQPAQGCVAGPVAPAATAAAAGARHGEQIDPRRLRAAGSGKTDHAN